MANSESPVRQIAYQIQISSFFFFLNVRNRQCRRKSIIEKRPVFSFAFDVVIADVFLTVKSHYTAVLYGRNKIASLGKSVEKSSRPEFRLRSLATIKQQPLILILLPYERVETGLRATQDEKKKKIRKIQCTFIYFSKSRH